MFSNLKGPLLKLLNVVNSALTNINLFNNKPVLDVANEKVLEYI